MCISQICQLGPLLAREAACFVQGQQAIVTNRVGRGPSLTRDSSESFVVEVIEVCELRS